MKEDFDLRAVRPTLEYVTLNFSRTPDRNFRCFYPCEKILSHTPVPSIGKDKKNE